MTTNFLSLFFGVGLLYAGGEALVRGASSIGARAGLSPLVIGLTIVAFGTSSPELFVSSLAALEGKSDIALANVIGSNICNIGLILATAALIRPLAVQVKLIRYDFPVLLVVSLVFYGFLADRQIGFVESVFLTVGLCVFCVMTFRSSTRDPLANSPTDPEFNDSFPRAMFLIVAGLVALGFGADFFVDAAVLIALSFGISEAVIGLTVVAIGTSLPELATSLVAAYRGQVDIAVGNVVGSNIFNILCVAGLSGLIAPLSMGNLTYIDLSAMVLFVVISMPLCRTGWQLSRVEGGLILALYLGYISYSLTI